jgi:hypothetical protein
VVVPVIVVVVVGGSVYTAVVVVVVDGSVYTVAVVVVVVDGSVYTVVVVVVGGIVGIVPLNLTHCGVNVISSSTMIASRSAPVVTPIIIYLNKKIVI